MFLISLWLCTGSRNSWIPELWTFNLDPWASIFETRSLNFELLILLMVLELWISNSPYFEIWLLLMDYKGKLWICWFLIFFILLARFSWLWMSSFLILFSWVLDEIYHFSDYMVCFLHLLLFRHNVSSYLWPVIYNLYL